jgi:hypothetical protein
VKSIATAMAMLALSAAPAALAQPTPTGQSNPSAQPYPGYQGYPGPSYQGQWNPNQSYRAYPPSDQPPYAEDQNDREAQQYDRSEDTYDEQLRQYQHDRREYERQRDAYDAQFDARDASAEAPPPPDAGPGRDIYRYSETLPFRDGPWERGERGGSWFREHGCRLAAPHDDPDPDPGHIIPVCPDADGHYRPAE